MLSKIILASKSEVRKNILHKNNIKCIVEPSNVDEDPVKKSLLKEQASSEIISKNLAELKANKVSMKKTDEIVLGADSVIDLEGELISKPKSRKEAMDILRKLNGKSHFLISSENSDASPFNPNAVVNNRLGIAPCSCMTAKL